jgi:polyisoprenoid-binding protein YceI
MRKIYLASVALILLGIFEIEANAEHTRLDFDRGRSSVYALVHRGGVLGLFKEHHVISAKRWFPNVRFDNNKVEASHVEFVISADSLDLDSAEMLRQAALPEDKKGSSQEVADLQAYLLGPAILDTGKFSEIRFLSTAVSKIDASHLRIQGTLAMHGKTRELSFPVEMTVVGPESVHIQGSFTLKLSDFGIQFPTEGPYAERFSKVDDSVDVRIDLITRPKTAIAFAR